MRPCFRLLWLCALLFLCSLSLSADDRINADFQVLGSVESPDLQRAFVVVRATVNGKPVYGVTVHELIQITRNDDGTFTRTYREEPCVLWLDLNGDGKLDPKERRWKQPNDHVCNVALMPGWIDLVVNEAAQQIALTWHQPTDKRKVYDDHALLVKLDAHAAHMTQLPRLE